MEEVVLVDEKDQEIGTMEKLAAHKAGQLHRAFSIFIYNSKGEMLLQKRALDKYHSGGLWTNACCSHPRPNEDTDVAAHRRLDEELGLSTPLEHLTFFIYKTNFENGLIEHELDHVFVGHTDQAPVLNPMEAADFRYVSNEVLMHEIKENPDHFTVWFKEIVNQVITANKTTS